MASKKLSRQLKKTFDGMGLEGKLVEWQKEIEALPDFASKAEVSFFLKAIPEFLTLVDDTYAEADEKVELVQRNLQVSSIELTDANKNLMQLNQTFDAMLNSLGQGFFLFDCSGKCLPIFSKACVSMIECAPAGKDVVDVLKIPESQKASFRDWQAFLFKDRIDFDDLAILGPQRFSGSPGHEINLEYKAVRDREGEISYIMVIATDKTSEIVAQRKADELQAHVTFLANALKDRAQFRRFVNESRRLFRECVEIVQEWKMTEENTSSLMRNIHTLKGAAGTFGASGLMNELHMVESKIKANGGPEEIKNELREVIPQLTRKFEKIIDENRKIVGDSLALTKTGPTRELDLKDLVDIADGIKGIAHMRTLYEQFIERLVSVPADKVFSSFNSVLQATAQSLGKSIKPLQIDTRSFQLIPENYSELLLALEHAFRNIADHGIETPERRRKSGKDPQGTVLVEVRMIPGHTDRFQLRISDDGGGIDDERIREKLREKGFTKEAERAGHTELIEWLFKPGFSTAERVSDTSGRGVGLDAIRACAEALGGRVWMESTRGSGTHLLFDLPVLREIDVSSMLGNAA